MKKLFVRGKKGFTLIELLIVIAIIAILATIIILNVLSARAKANDSKALSEMNAAAKVASVCLTYEGTLYSSSPTAGPVAMSTTLVALSGNICSDQTNSPGVWPSYTTALKGTKGTYSTSPAGYYTSASTDFTIVLESNTAGTIATLDPADDIITCSAKGCNKTF